MTWDKEAPYRPEVQKCRDRLILFCTGDGLDIGCGPEKITPSAIGVDIMGADVNIDLHRGVGSVFQPENFDYVFSSHCLEDFELTEATLKDWWNMLRVGGHLILYLPHKDHYPNIGKPGANKAHKHDFYPQDIIRQMDKFATYELLRNEVHSEDDEYSFDLVFRKIASTSTMKFSVVKKQPDKKALILRWGAYGDHIIASSCLPLLKKDGFHVTYYASTRGMDVLRGNPHIDDLRIIEQDAIPLSRLQQFYDNVENLGEFDKFVNLNATVEAKFLFVSNMSEYMLPDEERRKLVGDNNYYRYACTLAGYPDERNPRGQLFLNDREEAACQLLRQKLRDKFVILWSLSGSSVHKFYPFSDDVCLALLNRYPDMVVISVGDQSCQMIEFDHPRWLKRAGVWGIRDALISTKVVDMVVSPESAILNAAGCFDTPKLGFLTHSSKKQLTDTFVNDHSMQAEIPCSPCHRMVYDTDMEKVCPKLIMPNGDQLFGSACAASFNPQTVTETIEEVYFDWNRKRKGKEVRTSSGLVLPLGR